jgi:PPP family 3-phenylpropionic acid transporter
MQMALPVFFIFTIYAVVNAQLPLFLAASGYSITQVGVLLAVFECFGTICTLLLSPGVEKQKNYGIPLLLYGLLTVFLPLPVLRLHRFFIVAVCLGIYAVGYKGMVPLSDTVINNMLGDKRSDYGKVRAVGSFSFVIMEIILQLFGDVRHETSQTMVLWMSVPALLFCLSIFAVPGLISGAAGIPEQRTVPPAGERFSWKAELSGFSTRFWMGLLMIFVAFLATTPLNKFFSLYITDYLHIDAAPALWAVSATAEIPFMFFSGRLIRRYGSRNLLYFSTAFISIRLLVYILFPCFAGALAGQLLNAITYGIFHPAAIAFVSERVPNDKRVTGLTLYSVAANGFANIIGSAVGGVIIDRFGYPVLFIVSAILPPAGIAAFSIWRRYHT